MINALQGNTTFAYADDTAIVVSDQNIEYATEIMPKQLNIQRNGVTTMATTNGATTNGVTTNGVTTITLCDKIQKIKYTRVAT
ncbi:hypothetical protein DOY81_013472 [Sarcophaga bullata]|nr:hypothetical protein DOY81_013472 [Sarcophaga bullata]